MTVGFWIRVVMWSALTGGLVAIATFLLLDWVSPDRITIEPGVASEIVVVLDGAVATPGSYVLVSGTRLQAAIDAAGGFTSDADTTGVNLAGKLGDGDHLTIPTRRIADHQESMFGTPEGVLNTGLIDINTANVAELEQLPGIGPVIAQRIIDFRDFHGAFESIDQLDEVEGISPGMVEAIRPMVTIGG